MTARLFCYNDACLQSSKVSGFCSFIDDPTFFFYAEKEGDNTLRIDPGREPDHLDPAPGFSTEKGLLTSAQICMKRITRKFIRSSGPAGQPVIKLCSASFQLRKQYQRSVPSH